VRGFAILLAGLAWGQGLERLEPQGYLSDFANVVDAASRAQINAYLAELERTTGAQIAIVTVPRLGGVAIEDAAIDLYRRWGVGPKKTNAGALFLFAIEERKSRLEVGYGLEGVLPDGAAGSILRAMRPALQRREYGAAFLEAARQIGARIEKRPVAAPREDEGVPMWVVIALVLVLFALATARASGGRGGRGRYAGPWIIPMGGGFRGSSAGGSTTWGGFGGGDAGGGGASSDW
jgi:uncharacterized protein